MSDMPTLGRSRKRPAGPAVAVAAVVILVALFGLVEARAPATRAAGDRRRRPSPRADDRAATSGAPATRRRERGQRRRRHGAAASRPGRARSAADEELAEGGGEAAARRGQRPARDRLVARRRAASSGRGWCRCWCARSCGGWRCRGDLRRGDCSRRSTKSAPAKIRSSTPSASRAARAAARCSAYRFKAGRLAFAALLPRPTAAELELRLEDAPLDDYEQVTSLLRDGRGHKGVDFKTPVGTPVHAPFDGDRGAPQLELEGQRQLDRAARERAATAGPRSSCTCRSRRSLAAGAHVSRGEVVGKSGNTGHSFAPHLHYQLMTGREGPRSVRGAGDHAQEAARKGAARLQRRDGAPRPPARSEVAALQRRATRRRARGGATRAASRARRRRSSAPARPRPSAR